MKRLFDQVRLNVFEDVLSKINKKYGHHYHISQFPSHTGQIMIWFTGAPYNLFNMHPAAVSNILGLLVEEIKDEKAI
tara:strand:+ start:522 stop:752 length:231 start_codon:yes stop_codon:yes gene_type:complete